MVDDLRKKVYQNFNLILKKLVSAIFETKVQISDSTLTFQVIVHSCSKKNTEKTEHVCLSCVLVLQTSFFLKCTDFQIVHLVSIFVQFFQIWNSSIPITHVLLLENFLIISGTISLSVQFSITYLLFPCQTVRSWNTISFCAIFR